MQASTKISTQQSWKCTKALTIKSLQEFNNIKEKKLT